MERKVYDQYQNELRVGDKVCFIANPGADWRQTKEIARQTIREIQNCPKSDWLILDNDQKISPKRVVKCY